MQTAILTPQAAALERIKAFVLDGPGSPESRRAYSRGLDDLLRRRQSQAPGGFTKATGTPTARTWRRRAFRRPPSTSA